LKGVAGAGVLALYDRLQMIIFGKKFGGGEGWSFKSISTINLDKTKKLLF